MLIFSIVLPMLISLSFITLQQHQLLKPSMQQQSLMITQSDGEYLLEEGWFMNDEEPIALPATIKSDETISLTANIHIGDKSGIYGLSIKGIDEAYELLVDGQLVTTRQAYSPHQVVYVHVDQQAMITLRITPSNNRIGIHEAPTFADIHTMQQSDAIQMLLFSIVFTTLIILGLYNITLYFSGKQKPLFLLTGIYFILVSITLLTSPIGLTTYSDKASYFVVYKLKTIFGLLSVIPLYFIAQKSTNKPISIVPIIVLTSIIIAVISFVPQTYYNTFEISIWILFVLILSVYVGNSIRNIIQSKQLAKAYLLLVVSKIYLIVYIIVRIYYHLYGTNNPTTIWLLAFTLSIFIYLIVQQKEMVEQLEHTQNEKIQTEISFFNAQIKPHFIYNALGNIIALCYIDHVKAATLLQKFSTYLRFIFENNEQNSPITLQKELQLIDAYVEIEKTRFSHAIDYQLHVDEHLQHVLIPPLTIQPFVENAIRHGLFHKQQNGVVSVTIKKEKHLVVIIEDNGIGIPSDKLKHLLDFSIPQQGIGIRNVIKRTQLFDNSSVDIASKEGEGTTVTIQIPLTI